MEVPVFISQIFFHGTSLDISSEFLSDIYPEISGNYPRKHTEKYSYKTLERTPGGTILIIQKSGTISGRDSGKSTVVPEKL